MNFKEKVVEILQNNMSERGFKLWQGINSRMPDIWEKPTSSTGKYHKKENGEIPVQAEHVYHLLYSTVKLFRMFNIEKNTPDADKILLAVALHDSLKYGRLLTEEQFNVMEEAIRFHSGQWSTDVPKNKSFSFKDYQPETLFIHMLDMMSTADLIQTDVRD